MVVYRAWASVEPERLQVSCIFECACASGSNLQQKGVTRRQAVGRRAAEAPNEWVQDSSHSARE